MSTDNIGHKVRPGPIRRLFDMLDLEEKGHPPVRTKSFDGKSAMNIEKQLQNNEDDSGELGPTPALRMIPTQLLPASDKLQTFRVLTGINSPEGMSIFDIFHRSASNTGIYTRTIRAEKRTAFEFRFFSILINCCLGVQIVVAAALTALGAGHGPRGLVTAFGAVNTVIAGFLTYLKGSGLPNRKRYYQNEWTRIRLFIEQREREFCLEGCELDVEEEIGKIERMYEDVTADVEANTPENYSSSVSHNRTRRSVTIPRHEMGPAIPKRTEKNEETEYPRPTTRPSETI